MLGTVVRAETMEWTQALPFRSLHDFSIQILKYMVRKIVKRVESYKSGLHMLLEHTSKRSDLV